MPTAWWAWGWVQDHGWWAITDNNWLNTSPLHVCPLVWIMINRRPIIHFKFTENFMDYKYIHLFLNICCHEHLWKAHACYCKSFSLPHQWDGEWQRNKTTVGRRGRRWNMSFSANVIAIWIFSLPWIFTFPADGSVSRLIKGTAGKVEFKVTHHIPCSYVTMCVQVHISAVQTLTTTHELTIGVPLGRCRNSV